MSTFTEAAHPRQASGQFAVKQHAEPEVGLTGEPLVQEPTAEDRERRFQRTVALRDVADEFADSEEDGAGMTALDIARARAVVPHVSNDEFGKRWPEVMHLARMSRKYDLDEDDLADMAYHADVTEHVVDIDDFRDWEGVDFSAFGRAMATEYNDRYWAASSALAQQDIEAEDAAPAASVVTLPAAPVSDQDALIAARNEATRNAHEAEHLEAAMADPDYYPLGDEEDGDDYRLSGARRRADSAFARLRDIDPDQQVENPGAA